MGLNNKESDTHVDAYSDRFRDAGSIPAASNAGESHTVQSVAVKELSQFTDGDSQKLYSAFIDGNYPKFITFRECYRVLLTWYRFSVFLQRILLFFTRNCTSLSMPY